MVLESTVSDVSYQQYKNINNIGGYSIVYNVPRMSKSDMIYVWYINIEQQLKLCATICLIYACLIFYSVNSLLLVPKSWSFLLIGYRTLSQEVEEGICQVLAHMWLDSETISGSGSYVASTSSASSSAPTTSKKGTRSQFERKLGDFFKHQIESDTSSAYGDGFRAGNQAVLQYGLRRTLDHIRMTGSFPYWNTITNSFFFYLQKKKKNYYCPAIVLKFSTAQATYIIKISFDKLKFPHM